MTQLFTRDVKQQIKQTFVNRLLFDRNVFEMKLHGEQRFKMLFRVSNPELSFILFQL